MSEELTIEEAFAALGRYEQAGCSHAAGTCPQGIARAGFLAVLEAAHTDAGGRSNNCNCTSWAEGDRCWDYKTARAQIEALGKEE